ncbi:MAG: AgmX/PglI C-terminal domain-containing protein [Deltaproteobacteria bacterium]|nr:AgmX/PglI C-terminal domain-containing protein [Deltaproteobacteria bacterium]
MKRVTVIVLVLLAACGKKKRPAEAPATPPPSASAPAPSATPAPTTPPPAPSFALAAGRSDVKLDSKTAKRQGSLDLGIIIDTLKLKLPELGGCYEPALATLPNLSGNVQLAFQIGGDGKVGQSLAQGLKNDAVERCMTEVVRTVSFPPPPDGKTTTAFIPVLVKPRR